MSVGGSKQCQRQLLIRGKSRLHPMLGWNVDDFYNLNLGHAPKIMCTSLEFELVKLSRTYLEI